MFIAADKPELGVRGRVNMCLLRKNLPFCFLRLDFRLDFMKVREERFAMEAHDVSAGVQQQACAVLSTAQPYSQRKAA